MYSLQKLKKFLIYKTTFDAFANYTLVLIWTTVGNMH